MWHFISSHPGEKTKVKNDRTKEQIRCLDLVFLINRVALKFVLGIVVQHFPTSSLKSLRESYLNKWEHRVGGGDQTNIIASGMVGVWHQLPSDSKSIWQRGDWEVCFHEGWALTSQELCSPESLMLNKWTPKALEGIGWGLCMSTLKDLHCYLHPLYFRNSGINKQSAASFGYQADWVHVMKNTQKPYSFKKASCIGVKSSKFYPHWSWCGLVCLFRCMSWILAGHKTLSKTVP